ncbi:putative membrane protein [Helicobacter pylori Hp P-25d]|nr:putative membrane protein [Helicobacter pylori Hp P-25d]
MERFLQKKKNGILGGLALNFGGFLKTLFGIFRLFNVKSRQRK